MIRTITFAAISTICLAGWVRAQEIDSTGADAVAERLARMAQITLGNKNLSDENWHQSAALLEGATRLSPREPRFPKLLAEVYLQLKNTDAAIRATEAYLKLKPTDQLAQLQLIDLYTSQKQTAQDRLDYLLQLVQSQGLAAEVRAAVAVRAARIYLDRSQQQAADAMIKKARELNKYDPDACRMEYERAAASGTLVERINALLALLRANPAQPSVMSRLAAELADAGLHDQSQKWYSRAFDTAQRSGLSVDPGVFLDAACGALILGQSKTAEGRALGLLSSNPDNYDALLVRQLCVKRVGTEDQMNAVNEEMTTLLANRNNALHRALAGEDAATTQPSGELFERLPDIQADARAMKEQPQGLRELYLQNLVDMAYHSIYFLNTPADTQKLLAAIAELAPPQSVVLTRLEGWALLTEGKTTDAQAKLQAVADRDPLAEIGLIRIVAQTDKAQAYQQARALLAEYPSGLLGAIIVTSLADLELRPEPTADAAVIRDALEKFPMKWLDILDKPSDFYTLSAGTERVQFPFGKPILATVTIKNTSEFDIPFGPQGTLRPDLWVDCTIKGAVQQPMPGVAFDRMGGKLVLKRNDAIEHVVRVDQGQLWQLAQQRPDIPFPLYFSTFTNPVPSATIAAPGPAGYRAQFRKPVERMATPLFAAEQRNNIFKQLNLGDAATKVALHELFAQYIALFNRQQDVDVADQGQVLRQAVEQAMSEPEPITRAWAGYVTALLESEPRRSQLAVRLSENPDWLQRMLVLTFTEALPAETRDAILGTLCNDSDPVIKDFALATQGIVKRNAQLQNQTEGAVGSGN